MKSSTSAATRLALLLSLTAALPVFADHHAVGAAQSEAAEAEVASAERKAALETIDAQIKQIDRAVENAPDAGTKAEAELRLEALKERRAELRKDYAAAKARELKADTVVEYEKVAAWTKQTARTVGDKSSELTRDAKDAVTGPEVGPADTARAAANPKANAALGHIALYRLDPSPENKAEVKVALRALDAEIDRLDDHADDLPKGEARDALRARIKALEKRESALKRDFTKARWDAVVSDLQTEWDQIAD